MNKLKHTVDNQNPKPITVYLEPWAEEFVVPPKSVLLITISFTRLGAIDTVAGPDFLTIWLWQGCTAEVSLDGKDQTSRFLSTPAPG